MVAHIKKRMSRTERRAFSHTCCPSWHHTSGHRTGFLRVQNQPYYFFNNCKKEKIDLKNKPSDLLAVTLYYYFPTSTTVTRAHSKISRNKKDVTKLHKDIKP
jgi:hypothetical protein